MRRALAVSLLLLLGALLTSCGKSDRKGDAGPAPGGEVAAPSADPNAADRGGAPAGGAPTGGLTGLQTTPGQGLGQPLLPPVAPATQTPDPPQQTPTPAPAATPADCSPLLGQWRAADGSMEANFKADGRCSYRIRGEEGVETGEGAWKVEGDHLKVHTDGGDDVDLPWRLENGQLVLGPADDQTRLARVGPAPATTPDATPPALPPVTPPQPAGNRPNGDRLVGDLPMPSSYTPYRCLDVDNGFKDAAGRPMEVFNMLMPTGWRFAGGVKWILNYKDPRLLTRSELLSPARIAFTVSEPSGRCVLSVYPEERFVDLRGSPAANMGLYPQGSRYAGMIVCDAATPDNYILGWVIPRQRGQTDMANPQVVARKELPQAAALFAKEVEILNRAAGQAAIANVAHRAAMVTVDYDSGGVRWREMFVSVLMYIQTPGCTMWWHRYTISARAPRDEFASWQRYVVTAICSIRFNNAWLVRYLQVTDEAFAKIQDVDEYIRKIDHDIWANREQINLRIHRDMYPLLAPYADYLGADGKTRYLPTGGKYQANRRGEVREGDNLPEHDPEWQPLKLLEPQ